MSEPSIFGTLELPPDTSIDFTKPGDVSNWHDYFLRQRAMVSKIITVLESVTIAGGTDLAVKDEGVLLTAQASSLDFVGTGVTATHVGPAVTVTIPGGGGGFLKGDAFTASGTWTAPTGVTGIWLTMIAGGGSGSARIAAASGGGSGASGEFVSRFSIKVIAGTSYTVTIGAGGVGLAAGLVAATAGNPGGDTSFGPFYVRGGAGGTSGGNGGLGGGTNGGTGGIQAAPGVIGSLGTASTPNHFGGTGGSGGGSSVAANGGAGKGSGGFLTGGTAGVVASAQAGGGGGPATVYGIGGAGGNGGAAGSDAPAGSYGAGGGGAGGKVTTTAATGAGMSGYVLVQYVA